MIGRLEGCAAAALVELVVGLKLLANPKPMVEDRILVGVHGSCASFEDELDVLRPLSDFGYCSTMTLEYSSQTTISPSSAGVLQHSLD